MKLCYRQVIQEGRPVDKTNRFQQAGLCLTIDVCVCVREREREADIQTDRQTDRLSAPEKNRKTDI